MPRLSFELIAEVKTKSPFGFKSTKTWDELFEIANKYGDWLSIHTDPRWGGSYYDIRKARSLTDKPILAKGIHATDKEVQQALEAGADYVLVVGRVPGDSDRCIIEPSNLAELKLLPQNQKVVWNQRDLTDGSDKIETFEEARQIHSGWLCQASLIKTINDVHPSAGAVLVGEHLEQFVLSLN